MLNSRDKNDAFQNRVQEISALLRNKCDRSDNESMFLIFGVNSYNAHHYYVTISFSTGPISNYITVTETDESLTDSRQT
jgi:hypothetical protein